MWLDSNLNFGSHFKKWLKKAKTAKAKIKALSKTDGLLVSLIYCIQIAAVQLIVLYKIELWWKDQKTY